MNETKQKIWAFTWFLKLQLTTLFGQKQKKTQEDEKNN